MMKGQRNAVSFKSLRDVLNAKEVDAIFKKISLSNLSLFAIFKLAKITPSSQNCLVIQKMLSI